MTLSSDSLLVISYFHVTLTLYTPVHHNICYSLFKLPVYILISPLNSGLIDARPYILFSHIFLALGTQTFLCEMSEMGIIFGKIF